MSVIDTGDLIGLTIGAQGRRLLSLIEAFDVPFGLERSVKLGDGDVNEDRYLIVLHKTSLGPDPAGRLGWLARKLALPDAMLASLMEHFERSDLVAVGYEGGEAGVFKIYLEFSADVRAERLVDPSQAKSLLVHHAVKWRPEDEASAAVSRYVWPREARFVDAICSRLSAFSQSDGGLPSTRAARAIVEHARKRCQDHQIFYLEVEEEGSIRRSFDVNVYASGLQVEDIGQPVRSLGAAYGIAADVTDDLLRRLGPASLGHISGGLGRNGRDFATLYFGMMGRKGTARAHS